MSVVFQAREILGSLSSLPNSGLALTNFLDDLCDAVIMGREP